MLRKWFAPLLLLAAPLVGLEVTGTITGFGTSMRSVVLAPNTRFGYAASILSGTGRVSEFDTTTLAITGSVSTTGFPIGLAITPDGQYAYVASGDGKAIQILLSNLTVNNSISVGSFPQFVAIAPDGSYAYVTCFISSTVVRINLNTLATDSLAVAGSPIGIALTPDGKSAYVACFLDSTITKIDIDNDNFSISGIPLPTTAANPYNLAITPDGAFAYVVNVGFSGDSRVTKIDLATFAISGTPLAYTPAAVVSDPYIAISPHGRFAYVTNSSGGSLVEVSLATFSVTNTLSLGGDTGGIAITSDGTTLYVGSNDTVFQILRFPGPPSNLMGVQKKNNAGLEYNLVNQLNWLPSVTPESGYNVYRNGVRIATLQAGVLSYTDNGVQRGVVNEYQVRAVLDEIESTSATVLVP